MNKGWGVVTLDDIPAGSFICTYSAELLDDADQYGDSDMYYADLDYITVNEEHKRAIDSDDERSDEGVDLGSDDEEVPKNAESKKRRLTPDESDDSEASIVVDDENEYLPHGVRQSGNSRYPKRNQQARSDSAKRAAEPRVSFKKIHSILNESHDYTLDARMQGNVGRFFNHSCDPNAFVQNVFIESHDLRFPTVAFFASRTIKALDEITWNYNYKMGSIEGRVIECHCGAPNCRGRIL